VFISHGIGHDRQWCIGASPVKVHQKDERARACDGCEKAEVNWFVHPEEMKAKLPLAFIVIINYYTGGW